MSSEISVHARDVGKIYQVYRKPIDRLKQMLCFKRWKFFTEYWALRNVSLDIYRGETIGFIGRNGAGKSTLLQMICGILPPTSGELSIHGRVFGLLQLGAGFNPEFTGHENIYMAGAIVGLSTAEIDQRSAGILEFAAIGDFINQPVKTYSSGMYARLAFALAMHVDADILIVDEILSVGDAAFSQKCVRAIRDFKKKGTLLFVSHDTNAVINLCDRVVWLDAGEVREIGEAKVVCHNYLASIETEKDQAGTFKIGGVRKAPPPPPVKAVKDPRHELLKASPLRNDLEVFEFDPNAPWFGHRKATLVDTALLGPDGNKTTTLTGGEEVRLRIIARADKDISQPILGFYIKDRLGQQLFGDNTFLLHKGKDHSLLAGECLAATFHFQMPYLHAGDFSITPAIAEGTVADHVQHHWIDNALFFRVSNSHVSGGLIGIPMLDIVMERVADPGMGQPAGLEKKHAS